MSLPFHPARQAIPPSGNFLKVQVHGAIGQDTDLLSCPDHTEGKCLLGSFSSSEQDPTQDGTHGTQTSTSP